MQPDPPDIENQYDRVDLGHDNDPLLPKSERASLKAKTVSVKTLRRSLEVIELDDVPPIIKSANGNIFWADEQCTRRIGLTSTEARLLLNLLQTDIPENYVYDDYKDMFDDFGREQKRLQELVDALPWWKFDTYRQRSIWKARIQWLRRMEEPRLWLLYLMARRRRILKKAAVIVLERLREKRRIRLANGSPLRGRPSEPNGAATNGMLIQPIMLNDETQTSETHLSFPERRPASAQQEQTQPVILNNTTQSSRSRSHLSSPERRPASQPVMINDAVQTSESHFHFASAAASRIRDSLSIGKRNSHSRSSAGHCPIFEKPCEATREGIKLQVESIMPKAKPYIVIGWFLRSASDPKERIMQFEHPEDLFKMIRHGESDVREWRRFLSLKSLRGFGLYKCDISRGAHIPLALNASQEAVLSQLFLAYSASYRHADVDVARAWQGWVHKNLNNSKNNPLEGRYSLQLIYGWSSYRLSAVVAVPLLLSLAIGTWYMMGHGDVVTSWTLALYIVTAAAALIALMAIIGGLKDI